MTNSTLIPIIPTEASGSEILPPTSNDVLPTTPISSSTAAPFDSTSTHSSFPSASFGPTSSLPITPTSDSTNTTFPPLPPVVPTETSTVRSDSSSSGVTSSATRPSSIPVDLSSSFLTSSELPNPATSSSIASETQTTNTLHTHSSEVSSSAISTDSEFPTSPALSTSQIPRPTPTQSSVQPSSDVKPSSTTSSAAATSDPVVPPVTWDDLDSASSSISDAVKNVKAAAASGDMDAAAEALDSLKKKLDSLGSDLASAGSDIPNSVKDSLNSSIEGAKGLISTIGGLFGSGSSSEASKYIEELEGVSNKMSSTVKDSPDRPKPTSAPVTTEPAEPTSSLVHILPFSLEQRRFIREVIHNLWHDSVLTHGNVTDEPGFFDRAYHIYHFCQNKLEALSNFVRSFLFHFSFRNQHSDTWHQPNRFLRVNKPLLAITNLHKFIADFIRFYYFIRDIYPHNRFDREHIVDI
ncbi:hypothetical protein BU26DRAFT_567245 [Trematosphaeria pertusa]|uniref:Uncharacterized protein n=1 Tax=Trematosphaeria pertusa TaxID=390896 RepID=A0A6A6I9K9_9PLEO|nr:uncharacterized protein BU26DRAFT_567245 [Trematosphaeria pertusa]KAF2246909.1 hypothetical protein BU26DRAFT_567245 [Trematosphaeria pertusa]